VKLFHVLQPLKKNGVFLRPQFHLDMPLLPKNISDKIMNDKCSHFPARIQILCVCFVNKNDLIQKDVV